MNREQRRAAAKGKKKTGAPELAPGLLEARYKNTGLTGHEIALALASMSPDDRELVMASVVSGIPKLKRRALKAIVAAHRELNTPPALGESGS